MTERDRAEFISVVRHGTTVGQGRTTKSLGNGSEGLADGVRPDAWEAKKHLDLHTCPWGDSKT